MRKEKQIEEMAIDVAISIVWDGSEFATVDCWETAEMLKLKGYRKQSEAEWTYGENNTMKCTLCRRRMPKIILARFCPNCGAKMKGV